jgi:transcriptional regulator with XRE-family HTH domain
VVRRIFAERATGASFEAIGAGLNRDGIPSPSAGLWAQSSIAEILRNPAYIGRPRGRLSPRRSRRDYESIIDEATFNRVQLLSATSASARRKAEDLGALAQGMRMRRSALGLTQTEVARRAGVTPSTISRLESGLRHPEPQVLYAVAAALQVSVLDLMGEASAGEAADAPDLGAFAAPAGPVQRELRETLRTLDRGFPWLKPAERHLVLALLKLLAHRAETARGSVMASGPDEPGGSPE